MTHELNRADLVFAVDTTGSMGPFVADAKRRLVECVRRLGDERSVDLCVGVVEYRDHPPQESTFVTRAHPFTGDMWTIADAIDRLLPVGGGDFPEAVFDGVAEACLSTPWRPTSCRFVLLVGDAPPHGYVTARRGSGPESLCCSCGVDLATVTAAAEEVRATVHALPFGNQPTTLAAFRDVAIATGGVCAPADAGGEVVERILAVLGAEFANLDFDARVLDAVRETASLDTALVTARLGADRPAVARAIARLGRRGFLAELALAPA